MANLKQAFEYAAANPNSDFANNLKQLAASGSLDQEAQKFGIDLTAFKPKAVEPTVVDKLKQRGSNVATSIVEQANVLSNTNNPLEAAKAVGRGILRPVGEVAGAGVDIVNAGINAADEATGNVASTAIKKGLTAILNTPQGQEGLATAEQGVDKYNQWKAANPEIAKDLEAVVNIANIIPVGKAVGAIGKGAVEAVPKVAKGVAKGANEAVDVVKEGISPTPTFEKALGEVSIAKKVSQLPKFEKALSAIDTKDVKTFSELNDKFKKAIPDLAAKVDNELLKDINTYKIQDLLIPQKTKGGKEIKVDYITRSLDGLKDLYTKLGDDVAKADIEEFANKAETVGLTRKEVNDLARLYNTEYGSKAFTATGDIKTGFNAELYESTRKGLKDIARNGLGGDKAKALDDKLTAVYDAQKLTEKNTDAVNALKQRIEEKGWIGKGIRGAFELSDLFTGGAVRAVRDTVLARGNAQKLQNVLELENKLKKNLEVINKAMKAKTEKEATDILNSLSPTKTIYHGTSEKYDVFDKTKVKNTQWGQALYATDLKEVASAYGDTVKEFKVSKPLLNVKEIGGATGYFELAKEIYKKETGKDFMPSLGTFKKDENPWYLFKEVNSKKNIDLKNKVNKFISEKYNVVGLEIPQSSGGSTFVIFDPENI